VAGAFRAVADKLRAGGEWLAAKAKGALDAARSALAGAERGGERVSGWINPRDVRFSQDSIKATLSDSGGRIDDLARGLRDGTVRPENVPPIRLVDRDGLLFTLDNRRLWAFQQAGLDVPCVMATPAEVASEAWKFTTRNGGISIGIRGW
jgi:hypothetical protein